MLRRQLLIRRWIQIVTQLQKRLAGDDLTRFQSQHFCADTNPVSAFLLALAVIVVVRKVFVKIRFRRLPILLWNAAEH